MHVKDTPSPNTVRVLCGISLQGIAALLEGVQLGLQRCITRLERLLGLQQPQPPLPRHLPSLPRCVIVRVLQPGTSSYALIAQLSLCTISSVWDLELRSL